MNKVILSTILLLTITSCLDMKEKDTVIIKPGEISYEVDGFYYVVVVVDGCEYLCRHGYSAFGMAHKGNCSNPFHKLQGK
jgi:hypothetical protein